MTPDVLTMYLWIFSVGILLSGLGAFLFGWKARNRQSQYLSTQATVIAFQPSPTNILGRGDLEVSYAVNGTEYKRMFIRVPALAPVGGEIEILYDPQMPSRCVLRSYNTSDAGIIYTLLSLVLMGGGLIGVIYLVLR